MSFVSMQTNHGDAHDDSDDNKKIKGRKCQTVESLFPYVFISCYVNMVRLIF